VMKGVRVLSPASADRLMQALGIRIVDVMGRDRSDRRCPVCGCDSHPGGAAARQDLATAAFALSSELRARTRLVAPQAAVQDGLAARPTSR
jgi:hypothetical protein